MLTSEQYSHAHIRINYFGTHYEHDYDYELLTANIKYSFILTIHNYISDEINIRISVALSSCYYVQDAKTDEHDERDESEDPR